MRTILALLLGAFVLLASGAARAEPIFGLTTSNSLVTFESATPGVVTAPIAIMGLVGGGR